jgi:hypothetical protein
MAIGRPQMEEQIKGYADAGAVDKTDPFADGSTPPSINPQMDYVRQQMDTLRTYRPEIVPDYTEAYSRYLNILQPLTERSPKPSIYDLASSLSKGLTAQAQSSAPPSIGFGLAAGFNDFSDYTRARRQADLDQLQSLRMQAGTLAIQDVQAGEKLYQSLITQNVLRDPDKMGEGVRYVKYAADGKTMEKIKVIGDKDLITQQRYLGMGYQPIANPKAPSTVVDMRGKIGLELEKRTWTGLDERLQEADLKADAAILNNQSLGKFNYLQDQIDPSEFGRGAALVGGLKEYLIDIPIVGEYLADNTNIAARQALKNTQMGFVLEIVGPYKGAISNKELDVFQQSVASIANEKEANDFILITSKRANDVAMAYSEAANAKYNDLYNQFLKEEITGADARAEMRKFINEWGADNNPNSMIFTPEVRAELAAAGFADATIVSGDSPSARRQNAKINYSAQLVNQYKLYQAEGDPDFAGLTEQQIKDKAKQDTDILFGGIDDFSAYHNKARSAMNPPAGGGTETGKRVRID